MERLDPDDPKVAGAPWFCSIMEKPVARNATGNYREMAKTLPVSVTSREQLPNDGSEYIAEN